LLDLRCSGSDAPIVTPYRTTLVEIALTTTRAPLPRERVRSSTQSSHTLRRPARPRLANTDADQDPDGVMQGLGQALLGWRPNFFQILVSEIQNVLELEALAIEDEHLRDANTQAGLWLYLLESITDVDPHDARQVRSALESVVGRIVDSIRRRLATDADLIELAARALSAEITTLGWTPDTRPASGHDNLLKAAVDMTRSDQTPQKNDVLFKLNSFLSTERFAREHLTTGTIFKSAVGDDFWVAASPGCDMVARKPGAHQQWANDMHPTSILVAVRLKPLSVPAALAKAERGYFIFVEEQSGQLAFSLVDETTTQPSYEFLFPLAEGRVDRSSQPRFKALRITPVAAEPDRQLSSHDFVVVGQLRSANAGRLLQLTGQHLSRIGLDFFDLAK
jgi:hypothetical protein